MSYFAGEYDVAVIGAGHAGCEAGLAAARLGMKTAMLLGSLFPLIGTFVCLRIFKTKQN